MGVNQGMEEMECEVCLALANFYDSPPQSRRKRICEIGDTKPEECAIIDAPIWAECKQVELHDE